VQANASDDNYAEAVSGSGGLIAGAAATATTRNLSVTEALIGTGSQARPIDVGMLIVDASHEAKFNSRVDSTNASSSAQAAQQRSIP
jgi:hypothetical protein